MSSPFFCVFWRVSAYLESLYRRIRQDCSENHQQEITEVMLTEEEVRILSDCRDTKLRLEAMEFAYDSAVRAINFGKLMLEFLSIALAIIFLFILYILKDQFSTAHDIASIIGTGVSLIVIILVIWRHVAKWDEQAEKKSELSNYIHQVIDLYNTSLEVRPVSSANFVQCNEGFSQVESMKKDSLATLARRHIKLGHQHIAIKYPDLEIKCNVCGRVWSTELAKRRKWTNIIPFMGCDSCGV